MALPLTANPYEPAQSHCPKSSDARGNDSWLRFALYSHVVAIIGCALLSLTDTRQLHLDGFARDFLWFLLYPLVFSWIVWPSITIAIAWRANNRSFASKSFVSALSILLTLFQLWACLPLVQ